MCSLLLLYTWGLFGWTLTLLVRGVKRGQVTPTGCIARISSWIPDNYSNKLIALPQLLMSLLQCLESLLKQLPKVQLRPNKTTYRGPLNLFKCAVRSIIADTKQKKKKKGEKERKI